MKGHELKATKTSTRRAAALTIAAALVAAACGGEAAETGGGDSGATGGDSSFEMRVEIPQTDDMVDTVAQRSWERQREAHLAVAEATVAKQSKWFEEWRAHIHGLEKQLGRPLSGAGEDDSPPPS